MDVPGDVTKLLLELQRGNREAEAPLISLVYAELRQMARSHMLRERNNHTLQPTELVSEAYLRLVQQPDKEWQSRSHFYAVASQVMRRILVDYARARAAEKRGGGGPKISIDDIQVAFDIRSEELLDLDEALSRLSQLDPRQSRVVELRIFGGLKEEEIAGLLEVSTRTVKRDWRLARAWLYGEMKGTKQAAKFSGTE
jgi:RNA polymerase sigma-70 factor (ECF subfamily)